MMSSYVCRQCRERLLPRIGASRNPQWQPRATFIPFTSIKDAPTRSEPNRGTPDQMATRKVSLGPATPPQPRPRGRYSELLGLGPEEPPLSNRDTRHSGENNRDGNRGIRYVGERKMDASAPPASLPSDAARILTRIESKIKAERPSASPFSDADRILIRIESKTKAGRLDEAWQHFLTAYPAKLRADEGQLSLDHVQLTLKELLDSITIGFCKGGAEVPASPSAVLFKYAQLGVLKQMPDRQEGNPEGNRFLIKKTVKKNSMEHAWRDTIMHLTEKLLLCVSGAHTGQPDTESVLAELLSVWRLLLQYNGPQEFSLESMSPQWPSSLDASNLSSPKDRFQLENVGLGQSLMDYHPKLATAPSLAFSAVIMFNLLYEKSPFAKAVSENLRTEGEPLFRLMVHLLPGARMTHVDLWMKGNFNLTRTLPESFQEILSQQITTAPKVAAFVLGSKTSTEEEYLLKLIARASLEQTDINRLEAHWNTAVNMYTTDDLKPAIPLEIYNGFLTGFMALLATDRAIQVWNHMMAHGLKPDVKSWTAMLKGCAKGRDLNGLNSMWQRMIRSGTKPDNYAWTTRVHALISLHQMNDGFAALDEMGKLWLAAQKGGQDSRKAGAKSTRNTSTKSTRNTGTKGTPATSDVPRPSVEVINAATSAITQLTHRSMSFERKVEFTRRVLEWAGQFSIQPDGRTYNILIQLYMGGGDRATVFKLLNQMESEGIEADVATYTMLIRAAFDNDNFNDMTETEQASHITALFSQLEAGGLKLNAYIFSTIIDRLLNQYGNVSAVRTVVDYMYTRNLIPSPHIYTSLITHYFKESPPNIEAVDGIWNQILQAPGTPSDRILFDRVIEGFAAIGEVGKMMTALTVMSAHGKQPGYTALTAVIDALAEAGEWQRARDVVQSVLNGEGVAGGRVLGGRQQENHFYATVQRLGILNPEPEYAHQSGEESSAPEEQK